MEKRNVMQGGRTVCDLCDRPAVTVKGGKARCMDHAGEKTASADTPLKSAAETLSGKHRT